jgi:hypothetical protein
LGFNDFFWRSRTWVWLLQKSYPVQLLQKSYPIFWIRFLLGTTLPVVAMLYDIESASCQNCVLFSCLHRQHCINVVRYWFNIESTLCTFSFPVYVNHIIDVLMLYDINSTSCWYCVPFFSYLHRRHCNVVRYWFNIVLTLYIHFLLTSSTSSTLQCCRILNQHWVFFLLTSFTLSILQCFTISNQHSDNIMYFFHAYSVYIAMLYDIKSTLCRHCVLFSSFDIVHILDTIVVRYWINILSPLILFYCVPFFIVYIVPIVNIANQPHGPPSWNSG